MPRRTFIIILSLFFVVSCTKKTGRRRATGLSSQEIKRIKERGGIKKEIKLLKLKLKKDPDNVDLMMEIGANYIKIGENEKAVKYYDRVLKLEFETPKELVEIGDIIREAGAPELAIEAFDKALLLKPSYLPAHLNKGIVYSYDLKDNENAIISFKEFLKLANEDHPRRKIVEQEITILEHKLNNE